MVISGKTGVNGDVKTAFTGGNADNREYPGILGDARYLPVFSSVTGNGTQAAFTIEQFAAVRVMDVKMKGNPKWIILQPAALTDNLINVRLTR